MQKLKRICVLVLSALLILGCSFSSYADVNDLLINTGSNALMTLDLGDDDYGISTLSSVGTVTNTVDLNYVVVQGFYYLNGTRYTYYADTSISNGRLNFSYTAPAGAYIDRINFNLMQLALPPYGNYDFSFDVSSNIGMNVSQVWIYSLKKTDNAANIVFNNQVQFDTLSGDVYVAPYAITLNTYNFMPWIRLADNDVSTISGSVAFNFTPSYEEGEIIGGPNTSEQDYQSGVSSSLSNLSSSVDTMTDEISGVTEAIQNLQGAMEPHYNNVLTQLHHITEQLHAFYDQVYNNIHLPELSMLTQIKEAIENIDLQIEVDISEVKTAINNMSTAVQNKLQSTTDQITGGYDNSGMSSDKSELDGVLDQYEQAEEQLFDDAKGHINDFEFNTPLDTFTGPLADVSYFLNGMFEAMGPMNVVISFSLTLTIAMVMIGWYRFKGGR